MVLRLFFDGVRVRQAEAAFALVDRKPRLSAVCSSVPSLFLSLQEIMSCHTTLGALKEFSDTF